MSRTLAALALLSLGCLSVTAAAPQRDGAILVNSGSMNTLGYRIKVWSDGTAQSVRLRGGNPQGTPSTGSVPPSLAQKFFADLKSAKHSRAAGRACAKIPEFAYSLVVQYHGWTSPDLTCGGDGIVGAVQAEANKIGTALGVEPVRAHSVPMLPNEKRRMPQGETPQPSASPEPMRSAS